MNWIFLGLIAVSVLSAAFTGNMKAVSDASISSAKTAVELAIGLIGQMSLWLGLVGILREAGFLKTLARALTPVLKRLFPSVPIEHPAMGAMVMNLSANLLGLGNAATPFGLKAMRELDSLNDKKGVATDDMILFLGINSAGLALIPVSTIALRASVGSKNAAAILIPTLVATMCSTVCVILASRWLSRRKMFSSSNIEISLAHETPQIDSEALKKAQEAASQERPSEPLKQMLSALILLSIGLAAIQTIYTSPLTIFESVRSLLDAWTLPFLILTFILLGFGRGVNLYGTFVSAAKEGFQTAIGVIPFLVGMLVAIGMFRASGALTVLVDILTPLVSPFGFPAEAIPMVLIRPLSGSGASGVMSEIMKTHGADSFIGYLVSVLNGSTETTFYVIALYFGSIGIKHMRHGLLTCLVADIVGPTAAFVICRFYFAS